MIMDVSIIIVNFNTLDLTRQCVESIYKHTNGVVFEIIIIDNASVDQSVVVLKKLFPDIILIQNETNIGFGSANNIGMNISKGKYYFLLNSDTILLNNSVKIFFDFMQNSKNSVGAIGAVLLDSELNLNYKNSFNFFPTLPYLLKSIISKVIPVFRIDEDYYKCKLDSEGKLNVDFIVGADIFLRSEVISIIGNFDTDFFLYWEEVDLQLRMARLNYNRLIISGPKIVHLEGGSSQKVFNNWKRIVHDRHLMVYSRKHFNRVNFYIFKFLHIFRHLLLFKNRNFTNKEQFEYLMAIIKS